jgi:hypothetical protein
MKKNKTKNNNKQMPYLLLLIVTLVSATLYPYGFSYCLARYGDCHPSQLVSADMFACIRTLVRKDQCYMFYNSQCGEKFGCIRPIACESTPSPWCTTSFP